jgi:hypothetical protein
MGNRFETLVVEPLSDYEPEIGILLWMLESGRKRLQKGLAQMDAAQEQAILDWRPRPEINSIGSHLYHIAIVETDWLFMEVLADYTPQTAVVAITHNGHSQQKVRPGRLIVIGHNTRGG